ncbi:hypothetical protein S40285_01959 [Stachybotrys chlorohalonatus IBT 40285]|uniref:Cytochrome b5 heme-binding domain-containing protein n=1 Tax=Stachybotrys chlorohalonatus (strain IBT 40285) TaxID=1283841 RepID=A0A084QIF6_STAC4|nr:hypothetical protein S40285_01959 [Stachybotrys chlorohalonata IBT 40285]
MDDNLRQRKAEAKQQDSDDGNSAAVKAASKVEEEDKDPYSPWLDILRVITFIFVASWVLSIMFTGGESGYWGIKEKPRYMRLDWWRNQIKGPTYMTPEELSYYDGRDPEKPLLLAINGTIYDVSSNQRTYGPGGSYNHFTGHDAARAFVTGCFADDRTPDMRGVEEMFMPVDNPEIDSYWTAEELAQKRIEERKRAEEQAYNALKHWVDFFAKSDKYLKFGYVKRDPDWLDKVEPNPLCAQAMKARPKRKIPKAEKKA